MVPFFKVTLLPFFKVTLLPFFKVMLLPFFKVMLRFSVSNEVRIGFLKHNFLKCIGREWNNP